MMTIDQIRKAKRVHQIIGYILDEGLNHVQRVKKFEKHQKELAQLVHPDFLKVFDEYKVLVYRQMNAEVKTRSALNKIKDWYV